MVVEHYDTQKKLKTVAAATQSMPVSADEIKALKKERKLATGLNDVNKVIQNFVKERDELGQPVDEKSRKTLLVCILYNQETESVSKSLISLCRTFDITHVILSKFVQAQLIQLFRVRRLTCFSLLDSFGECSEKEEFLAQAGKFDNRVKTRGEDGRDVDLGELRYAEEQMFKPCRIKRWNIIKQLVRKNQV